MTGEELDKLPLDQQVAILKRSNQNLAQKVINITDTIQESYRPVLMKAWNDGARYAVEDIAQNIETLNVDETLQEYEMFNPFNKLVMEEGEDGNTEGS